MSQNHGRVDDSANYVRQQGPGDQLMGMQQVVGISTVGAGIWTAVAILAGIIDRTGPVAGYADTADTADNILAAAPELSPGDSFEFLVRNTVAQINTVAVSEGVELAGNTTIAASLARTYLMTCLSNRRRRVYQGTTDTTAVVTGFTQAQVDTLSAGMGISGTNITAGTTVIGVNAGAGTVTLSAVTTGSGTVGLTFFPRFSLKGLFAAAI